MKLMFRWKHTVTDASLWKRSEVLCFLNFFPPHVHAKEGEKKMAYVAGRVSGCEGMGAGIGWESVRQETTGCESGWRELR